ELLRASTNLLKARVISLELLLGVFGDGLQNQLCTVSGIGVVAQELRHAGATLLLQLGKELDHIVGIEAGVVHNLRTQQVGFALGVAGVFQKDRLRTKGDTQARKLAKGALRQSGAQHRQRDLRQDLLAGLLRAVAQD